MGDILIRAACYIAIILLGFLLRRWEIFKEGDFHVLSTLIMKITLPAAIVCNVAGRELGLSTLLIILLGLLFGLLYLGIGALINLRGTKEERAFGALNMSGYNIGNFALPFTQSFLGPVGVTAASLFDTGNAFLCLGGAYSIAAAIQGEGRFSLLRIFKTLFRSVPFDTYLVMIALSLLHLRPPQAVLTFAAIPAGANTFLAMLMVGVGFQFPGNRERIASVLHIILARYGVAVLLALGCWSLLPLDLEYRQALVLLLFSPISAAAPSFTADLHNDFGLASAVNSLSIMLSTVLLVAVLMLIL